MCILCSTHTHTHMYTHAHTHFHHTRTHTLLIHCTCSIILGHDTGPSLSSPFIAELRNLYYFVTENLIRYMAKIHNSKREMGELLLDVLCYINAVDYDNMSTFPEVFASCLLYFLPSPDWERAADDVMNRLCRYVLPRCLGMQTRF